MSASTPKATGGVQVILMVARAQLTSSAVQAHTAAGELPSTPVCGITVEQSPSERPNAKAKGNGLGVSAQLIGDEGGDGDSEGGEDLDNRRTSASESAELQMVMDFTHASVAW